MGFASLKVYTWSFLRILYNLKVSIGTLSPWAKPMDRYGIGIWYPSLSLSYWSQSRKSILDQIAVCSLRRSIRNDKDVKTTLKSNTKRVRHWCYMLDILFFFFCLHGLSIPKVSFLLINVFQLKESVGCVTFYNSIISYLSDVTA